MPLMLCLVVFGVQKYNNESVCIALCRIRSSAMLRLQCLRGIWWERRHLILAGYQITHVYKINKSETNGFRLIGIINWVVVAMWLFGILCLHISSFRKCKHRRCNFGSTVYIIIIDVVYVQTKRNRFESRVKSSKIK